MPSAARTFGYALLAVAGVALAAAAPRLFQLARPTLREGLKRGLSFADRAKTAAAKLTEDMEDLLAEVKEEIARERPAASEETPPPPEQTGQPPAPSVRAA